MAIREKQARLMMFALGKRRLGVNHKIIGYVHTPIAILVIELIVFAAAYAISGRLGLRVAVPPASVATALWPPSGIALSAVLLRGYRIIPAIMLGSLLTNSQQLLSGANATSTLAAMLVAFAIAVAAAVEAGLGRFLINRYASPPPRFETIEHTVRFLIISAAISVVGAALGVGSLYVADYITWEHVTRSWTTWWVGDVVGILIFTPIILSFIPHAKKDFDLSTKNVIHATVFCLLFTLFGISIFWTRIGWGYLQLPLMHLFTGFILWAAFRMGHFGVVVSMALLSVIAMKGTFSGMGPFARSSLYDSILFLQLFLGFNCIVGLLVDALLRDRREKAEALKTQSELLARSNAELEQFAFLASHDLKAPLRAISLYVELLARRYQGKLDSDADQFIQFAVDGSKRLSKMIDDLLLYAQIGRQKQPNERILLHQLVDQVLFDLSVVIAEKNATVRKNCPPLILWGHKYSLIQLLQNLVSNSLKFCGTQNPIIEIGYKEEPRNWLFWVQDNGIGIPQNETHRIFELFRKLHSADKYPGNGMGLAICKKIVSSEGGRIWVKSQPGKGSTFYWTLPKNVAMAHKQTPPNSIEFALPHEKTA